MKLKKLHEIIKYEMIVRNLFIVLSFILLTSPLFGEDKPCYVSVTSSEDFNQTLLSNISISVISQYLKNVKPFPPSGLSGDDNCIYEVTATKDKEKTFVTLQGKNLNSYGDASISGKHCNFFINKNNATFNDMNKLIKFVKKKVEE